MDKTSLGDRMKGYENVERHYLPMRDPLCIRIDGRAFHTYTHGFLKPFDLSFLWCMRLTMLDLCKNIATTKIGYHQSDEITLVLTDDDTPETSPWFGKNLQKVISVSASLATFFFQKNLAAICSVPNFVTPTGETIQASMGLQCAYREGRLATFDSRAWTVPRHEVLNVLEWRQQDCIRNSVQSVGQANFSHRELHGKSCADIKEMLKEKGIDWDSLPTDLKRGTCAIYVPTVTITDEGPVQRYKWTIGCGIPVFHKEPDYINDLVYHRQVR